jgi:hypothetical protein
MCREDECDNGDGVCEKGGKIGVSEMYLLATNTTARIMNAQNRHEDLNSFSSLAYTYIDRLPGSDDPVAMAVSVMLCMTLVLSLVARSFRHGRDASFRAPLLEGA